MEDWIWPLIDDVESARRLARFGALWAGITGVISLIAGVLSGHYAIAAISFLLYATAAWRMSQWSFAWSVVGLSLCVLQTLMTLIALPILWSIIMPFALFALLNGMRATGALRRLPEEERAV